MDPFDDYDPQAYDYDESDQEDDIVYLEGNEQGEDPFLPYLAKDVELSQSLLSQASEQQQAAVPNLLPRRERERRRTEAAAQMMEESSDSELSNGPGDKEEQDTFASLQSLLEKQSQQEREKAALKADEKNVAVAEEATSAAQSGAAKEPGQPVPMQDDNITFIPESQSQFPVADDDWELPTQANPTQTRNAPLVSNTSEYIGGPSSISSDLTRELQRHRKQQPTYSQPAVDLPSTVDSNLLSELEKNRKRAQKKTTNSSTKRHVGGSTKSNTPQFQRKAQVTSSKSIVGSR